MRRKGQWGLYDTTDNLWLADRRGLLSYDDLNVARKTAKRLDSRMNHPVSRTLALPLNYCGSKKSELKIIEEELHAIH